jgi:malate dehydrogenase
MTIWGNHSATQYPDISQTLVNGESASEMVDGDWYRDTFIPAVQQRGAAIIEARGSSSAASAANASVDHIFDWFNGTPDGDWVSMGIPSDGSYGIPGGLIYSFPVTCKNGEYDIVQDLPVDDFSREKMDATAQELSEERDAIKDLL